MTNERLIGWLLRARKASLSLPFLILALLVTAPLLATRAAAQDRAMPESMPERPRVPIFEAGEPFLEKVLKNGVRLLVQEQRTGSSVAGVVSLRMGIRYETEETAGLGHVLARTMIAGTSRSSASDFIIRLKGTNSTLDSNVGADVGQVTIVTDREHAPGAAALLADVVLAPSLPDSSFEAARLRATTDATFAAESPLPAAYGEFLSTMFAGTPYRRHLQGLVPAIAEARRADIVALHKRVTAGGNITVLFIGNFDGKKLLAQMEKAFAAAQAGPALAPSGPEPQPPAADTTVVREKPWLAHACVVGFPAPGYADPDYPAFAVIDSYLRSEDRSPITYWMTLREDAVSPGVVYNLFPNRAAIAVYFGATTSKLGAARDTALTVLQRLRTEPLDKGEWSVQLARVQNGFFFKQEDPLIRARFMSRYASQGLPLDYPRQFETALLKLTPEDVRTAAERWLTHSCVVVLGPASAPSGAAKP